MNAEVCAGQSIAAKEGRARSQAAKADSGPDARLRVAMQRGREPALETPRTTDATATTATDTLANPTNVAYCRRLSFIQTIPPVASPRR